MRTIFRTLALLEQLTPEQKREAIAALRRIIQAAREGRLDEATADEKARMKALAAQQRRAS